MRISVYKKTQLAVVSISLVISSCYSHGISDIIDSSTDPNSVSGYRVFVSSMTTQGDMSFAGNTYPCSGGGIDQANCICQNLASDAGLVMNNSSYRAWISDNSRSAKCNIIGQNTTTCSIDPVSDRQYIDVNGNLVFNSWSDISNGGLPQFSLNSNEFGGGANTNNVWTGTLADGSYSGVACIPGGGTVPWTDVSAASSGSIGDAFSTSSFWTDGGSTSCSFNNSVYCFEGP